MARFASFSSEFPGHTFTLDVMNKPKTDPLMQWLKGLMDDGGIVKIVPDCRMDSEALWHQKGIKLINVHDTSCWHNALTGEDTYRTSLTNALRFYGLPGASRDNSIYRTNPAFWAKRPLTGQMVDRAAGDIDMLMNMRDKQLVRATSSQALQAIRASEIDSREAWREQAEAEAEAMWLSAAPWAPPAAAAAHSSKAEAVWLSAAPWAPPAAAAAIMAAPLPPSYSYCSWDNPPTSYNCLRM